ncbi:glycosyltransferase family 2 protein [Flavobacterium psychrotolerans]|uniref:Glycosyltransferase family 2 protein n=1 Tax=Flavobacterium psychrotolerans TaxID=2169410 RepID=A0A2U1JPV6_9FLAO|nr:glycosyltransferase family 2 protein [Flavobacterium psychrotolerans]PWA07201.1 glycosyltransferase family 2 protein [Flavobacterium psychrotolerans]
MPFFSIIIPLYNKENFIENTLKSVINQSFTDFEIIIVNDGSTDASEIKAKQFIDARIRYFSKENEGVSSARNYGIALAQSDYISFIDADDYWYPNFLQEMFENINRFSNQKVFSAAIEIETSAKIIEAQYSIKKTSDCEIVNYFDASVKTTAICTSCAVFHKSLFEEIGNFDINLKSGQDTDLWIRIGLIYPVLFSWKILARYVHDSNSLSKRKEYYNKKMDFSKFTDAERKNPALRKFLDLNRFSFAIKSKLNNDKINFENLRKGIDLKNLSSKKRILLKLPATVLKTLIALNLLLIKLGLTNSVFK